MKQETSNTFQAFWVGLGSLSAFGLSIVSAAILSRYFDKAEYGTYRQILYVYNTLLVVFSAGLPRVFGYFLPRFNLSQGKDVVWKITKILGLGGLAFSISLFFLSQPISTVLNNPELERGLKYFSPVPMLLLPTLGIEGIFSTYRQTRYIALYNVMTRSLMLLLIVLPVLLLHGNYLYAIYGWIAGSLVSLIIAGYFKGVPFKGTKIREAGLSYREVFAYSLPLVSASIAGIAIKAADQFYISAFFGAEVFAEFSNGFIELPFVMMITGATSTVLMPIFSRMKYDKADMGQVITLFRNAILKSATLIYPLVTFFLFNAEAAIVTLFSSTYTNSAIYFQIAMLLNFFNVIIFAPLLFAMGKTKLYSNIHIVFAFAIWTLGYPVVVIFNSPIGLANLSVCLGIVKIMVLTKLTAESMRVTVYSLIPFKRMVVLIVHSFITVISVKILLSYTLPQTSELLSLILNFGGCIALILLTGDLFSLNYKLMLQALWDKRTILSNV